ncbi:hypothetical protein [Streptomyces sp. NPDC088350]|uniref:hypothetical protein n=1 Tax=Streptomyces sp. NPDC088350 TaxID=3365854 RepID=UPI0038014F1D
MSEIVPRRVGTPIPRNAKRTGSGIHAETYVEQTAIHALASIGEFAVAEVQYLKQVQRTAENANPDCAEAVAYIVGLTVQGIARSVQHFSSRLD